LLTNRTIAIHPNSSLASLTNTVADMNVLIHEQGRLLVCTPIHSKDTRHENGSEQYRQSDDFNEMFHLSALSIDVLIESVNSILGVVKKMLVAGPDYPDVSLTSWARKIAVFKFRMFVGFRVMHLYYSCAVHDPC